MIFLNPAVLFGLLAAAIPVLIHLLNLKKLKRIEFSTLAFLKELQKNKIRKLKLKQWLLLALRVMLILLIVFAFARPTLKGVAIGGTTSAAKTTAVFIIDNTFSMSVITPEGSYFNQAKQIAGELINNLQEGDEAALVPVSGSEEELTATGNLIELSKKIKELQLSYVSGTLDKAIINAAKILGQSRNFNKEIYIISDYQKGRLKENETISDLGDLLNANVKIYAFNLPHKDIINISIDSLELNTRIFEKNKPVSFNVTLTNNSAQTVTDLVLSLFVNGERSAQQSITLQAAESQTITIESHVESSGYIDVVAEIEDDDILQDNKRSITFNIPEKIPVGLFASDPDDLLYTETALSAYGDESKLVLRKFNFRPVLLTESGTVFCNYSLRRGSVEWIRSAAFIYRERRRCYYNARRKNNPAGFNTLLNSVGLNPVEGSSGIINGMIILHTLRPLIMNTPFFRAFLL